MSHSALVSAEWLSSHLTDDGVAVLDASWHLPATGRDAYQEYLQAHIPGARFFDIDKHSAVGDLPHMLPDSVSFGTAAGHLGISLDSTLVVYDSVGLFSAARVWWMFKYFGMDSVYVLNGGLPAWSGNKLESGPVTVEPREFTASAGCLTVVDSKEVLQASLSAKHLIFDARPMSRFSGEEPEARPGLRSGHIPNSRCLPFPNLLTVDGFLKPRDELREIFTQFDWTPDKLVVTTCGSGVTAAIILLAMHEIGITGGALYDGSWAEWGGLNHLPVDTGRP